MTLPYWADEENAAARAWNTCILGPVTLPGIATVTAEKGRDTDLKKAKGKDGYGMTDNGASPGKVNIDLALPTSEAWRDWQRIRPTIDPNRPGGARSPLEIQHPAAADRGIQNIYVKNIKTGAPTSRGGMRISIECEEWFPKAKPAKANTKALPAAKMNKNTFVSSQGGETQLGQDMVKKMTEASVKDDNP